MPRSTLLEHPSHPPSIMSSFPSSFQVEDFFNLDMLTGSGPSSPAAGANLDSTQSSVAAHSGLASSSSRSSSRSPSDSFSHLPPTPPQPDMPSSFDMASMDLGGGSTYSGLASIDEESMFSFNNYDSGVDFLKPGTDPLAGLSHPSFDLFGSFDSGLGGVTSASATTSGNNVSASSDSYSLAIDPQLVRTPMTSSASQREDATDDERDKDDKGAEEDVDEVVIAPVKVGGKGKSRKGTLHSGGVIKKSATGPPSIFGSLSNGEKLGAGKAMSEKDDDADDWRPSPEEYQKMSSKEKRQLRNKISARNFRVRRKEYIHTLEGDIAERDRLIDAIRSELGSTKSENHALRQEVATLKKAILEGRASPMLPPPAPLSPLSPLSSFSTLQSSASSSSNSNNSGSNGNIIKPNTHKDLPTSPRLAAISGSGAFWGGQAASFSGLGGGITPVHTAIIPETTFNADRSNENMNPGLNQIPVPLAVAASKVFGTGSSANVSAQQTQQQAQARQNNILLGQVLSQLNGGTGSFDSFSDSNPFTLKTLDAYRMQLWGRVAMQAQQQQRMRAAQANAYPSPPNVNLSPASSQSPSGSPNLSGLASGLRPHYFSTSSTPPSPSTGKAPFSTLLSGKGTYSYHGLPSPPPSPRMGEKEQEKTAAQSQQRAQAQVQAQQHALLATLASQTVLQKMGQAFWDAFSGGSASGSGNQVHGSVSSTSASGAHTEPALHAWDADKVRRVLEGKAVLRVVDVERSAPASAADGLEESMRVLSLGSGVTPAKEEKKEEKKGFLSRMSCGRCNSKQ